MEASRQQLLGPMAVRPPSLPERESGCVLVKRITRHATAALLLANLAGGVVTFALGAWIVPPPHGLKPDTNLTTNIVGFAAALVAGLVVGTFLSARAGREAQLWLREDRPPTPEEREATLRFPIRQTLIEAGLWAAVVVEFVAINIGTDTVLGVEAGLQVLLGGLVTCSLTYLLVERLNREATARALE